MDDIAAVPDAVAFRIWKERAVKAEQQRDELLEALRVIAAMSRDEPGEVARMAIAQTEGRGWKARSKRRRL